MKESTYYDILKLIVLLIVLLVLSVIILFFKTGIVLL